MFVRSLETSPFQLNKSRDCFFLCWLECEGEFGARDTQNRYDVINYTKGCGSRDLWLERRGRRCGLSTWNSKNRMSKSNFNSTKAHFESNKRSKEYISHQSKVIIYLQC